MRELKIKPISECRYDERLKTKAEESTRLTYTGSIGELEHLKILFVDYETINRELKIKPISECRYDERLKTKVEESTCLSDTGLFGVDTPSILRIIRKSAVLPRVRTTLDLSCVEKRGQFPDEPVRKSTGRCES